MADAIRQSEDKHLELNICKTMDLLMDFRWSRKPSKIQWQGIEVVDYYKFLGVHNNVDWLDKTKAFYRKGQRRPLGVSVL